MKWSSYSLESTHFDSTIPGKICETMSRNQAKLDKIRKL